VIKFAKFEVFGSTNDMGEIIAYYWRLRAANGEIQCVSESYPTKRNAQRGAKQARANSRFATIVLR